MTLPNRGLGDYGHISDHDAIAALLNPGIVNTVDGNSGAVSLAGTYVQHAGVSNGGDDTSHLNSLLASGGYVKGKPGQTYLISAPLVIPSSTTLDMSGCTVRLNASSNCNMVQNKAVGTAQRSVSDAAITSGTSTLTSATAAFTSADVGRSVVITGAGPGGSYALSAVITAYTNATTVTLGANAGATVSAAACSIYNRDTDIAIVGGHWDRGSNGGTTTAQHSVFLRRLDRLRIDIDRFSSTGSGPKYAINPGDVTLFDITVRVFDHVSDGVHIAGPASSGVIHNVGGTTGDDFVVLAAADHTRPEDGAGDVTDIAVYDLRPNNIGTDCCFKAYGETGTTTKRISLDGVRGASKVGMVEIGASGFTGGTFDEIRVSNVITDENHVVICYVSGGTLRVRDVVSTYSNTGVFDVVNTQTGANWTLIDVSGVTAPNTSGAAGGSAIVNLYGNVTDLFVSRVKWSAPGSCPVVLLSGAATSVTHAMLSAVSVSGGAGLIKAPTAGQTVSVAWLSDCYLTGASFVCDLNGLTNVHLSNVQHDSPGNGSFNLRASASVTILGHGAYRISGSVSTAAGYALRVNCPDFQVDLSKITAKLNGDVAFNSNGALACGAGPAVSNGTNWKGLYSGATY